MTDIANLTEATASSEARAHSADTPIGTWTEQPHADPKNGTTSDLGNLASRIAWLEARYLKNARDDRLVEHMQEILETDAAGALVPRAIRDPLNGETRGVLLIGASGDGKSVLVQRNLNALENFVEMNEGSTGNYIHLTVPPEATLKGLAVLLLQKTGYSAGGRSAKAHELWSVARHRLALQGIELLWIDEAHHLLRPGSGRDVPGMLQTLKSLLQGKGSTAVILSGVPKLDQDLLPDPETSRRFYRLRLSPVVDGSADLKRIGRFIEVCCNTVGLDAPADRFFAERVVFASGDGLGRSLELTKAILRRALLSGDGGVSLATARKVFALRGERDDFGPFEEGEWTKIKPMLVKHGWGARC